MEFTDFEKSMRAAIWGPLKRRRRKPKPANEGTNRIDDPGISSPELPASA